LKISDIDCPNFIEGEIFVATRILLSVKIGCTLE